MKNQMIIFVGWVNAGRPAFDGETMKNQLLIQQLRKYCDDVCVMDFYGWRKRPWVCLNLLWTLLIHPSASLVLSSSPLNVYPILKLMFFFRSKRKIIHWAVGARLLTYTKNGIVKAKYWNYGTINLVQSRAMVQGLHECGVNNVLQVPNSKPISHIPKKSIDLNHGVKFVFLSRIIPEKGCDLILDAVQFLNQEGYGNGYGVDFYGKIDKDYHADFIQKTEMFSNVRYQGIINLREEKNYDELAKYHVMLFPTFWEGEAFAGVFIDAFIAGLPIIVSDWNHNKEFVKHGETGIVIPAKDTAALIQAMKDVIHHKIDIVNMSINCQKEAKNHDTDTVITEELLKKIGLL